MASLFVPEFDTPLDAHTIQGQIDANLRRGLPESLSSGRALHIVANGPSALLRPRLSHNVDTLAVNGALSLFGSFEPPHFWMACDPQGLVLEFLSNPPPETTYLLASKVHPDIFTRLRHHAIEVFHINDHAIPDGLQVLPVASTTTLTALLWAVRRGYRDIHCYGWDCCLMNGQHHAGVGRWTKAAREVLVGEGPNPPSFQSTNDWAAEVDQAVKIISAIQWCGVSVQIHGLGLLRAALDYQAHLTRLAFSEPSDAP